jgi:hypothetical protein
MAEGVRMGLEEQFEKAGLTCQILKQPIRSVNSDIFQMDIQRKIRGNARSEYFRIWPGGEHNRVEVVGVDKEIGQLVLMVAEEKRIFWSPLLDHEVRMAERMASREKISVLDAIKRGRNTKDVRKVGERKYEARATAGGEKMHYLCGVDERQLFIARLPKAVSTVRDAHACLKRTDLLLAEGRAPGKTIRQGEWFFVPATHEEVQEIEFGLKKKRMFTVRNERIPGRNGGKPHVAEQMVKTIGLPLRHGFAVRDKEVFVKGRISHSDHESLNLRTWHKVILNNEGGGSQMPNQSATGVYWID